MNNGELGTFVTAVNSARNCNTLGQINEGEKKEMCSTELIESDKVIKY